MSPSSHVSEWLYSTPVPMMGWKIETGGRSPRTSNQRVRYNFKRHDLSLRGCQPGMYLYIRFHLPTRRNGARTSLPLRFDAGQQCAEIRFCPSQEPQINFYQDLTPPWNLWSVCSSIKRTVFPTSMGHNAKKSLLSSLFAGSKPGNQLTQVSAPQWAVKR